LYSGVTVIENCAVIKVINQSGQIKAVETTYGIIECQHFVNCAGFWARNVGKLSEPHVKVKDIQQKCLKNLFLGKKINYSFSGTTSSSRTLLLTY